MKSLLSVLLLATVASVAFAQPPYLPDVSVSVRGWFVRKNTNQVSILLGDKVDNLGSISFTLLDPPLDSYIVGSPNVSVIEPGELLQGIDAKITGGEPACALDARGMLYYCNHGVVTVTFPSAVSGPGELLRFNVYSDSDLTRENDSLSILLGNVTATDTKGNPLTLHVFPALFFHYDFQPYGDVTGDGKFDLKDVTLLLKAALGIEDIDGAPSRYGDISPMSLTGKAMPSGRLSGDGKIDMADVTTGLRVVLGFWKYWWPDPL